jgi:hypothetical protein
MKKVGLLLVLMMMFSMSILGLLILLSMERLCNLMVLVA